VQAIRLPCSVEQMGKLSFSLQEPPLGVVNHIRFEQAEATLAPGDKLILYTDGITEARDLGDMFGIEGLCSVVESTERKTPILCDQVIDPSVPAATAFQRRHCPIIVERHR